MKIVLVYLFFINIITFFIYGYDKRQAIKDQWRISEKTLILLAIIGGSLGAMMGMRTFHHKTLKNKFRIGIPVIVIVQIIVAFLLAFYIWVYIVKC